MSNENSRNNNSTEQSSITRRNVLGAVGGAAGATFGVGFVRSASATASDVAEIQNSTPTQRLLSAVGNPSIVDSDVKVYEGERYSTQITNFETEIGTLSHHKALSSSIDRINQGDTSVTFD